MLDIKKILNELSSLHISDEDYEALIDALKKNKLKEQIEKQKDAWMKIIKAINEYTDEYGFIKILFDTCDGIWNFSLDDFSLDEVGKIRIFSDVE